MKRPSPVACRLLAVLALCWLATGPAAAQQQQQQDILPAKEAYRYTATVVGDEVVVRYKIARGYYLYRDRMALASTTPGVTIGVPRMPAGEEHDDEYFGRQVIYRGPITVAAKIEFDGAPRAFDLQLKLQGCADAGLCYPPQTWITHVESPGAKARPGTDAAADAGGDDDGNTAADADGKAANAAAKADDTGGGGFSLRHLLGAGQPTESDLLPADQAFVLAASSDSPDRISLHWAIADGYYLYRDKVKVTVAAGDAQLGQPSIPGGKVKHDEYFGDQVVFFDRMDADVPVATAAGNRAITLEVGYQGCAEAGLCYPPIRKTVQVELAPPGAAPAPRNGALDAAGPMRSAQDALADKIRSGSLLAVLATFFGAGLLLAFTPCVLPMVPILSGIIVGAGRDRPVSRGRAFSLSLAYVLGMAFTYTVAGAAFAAAGRQAQAFFQQPWIIVVFAGLFVLLALGMFGVFNLQVPAAFQERVAGLSNRQKQGTLIGTAVMGALSSLIVTACVAPPLVAALAVIGQSGNVFRGGAALFALSLGMGAPLLLVGASAGRLLPRAGPWMDAVKSAFGVMMLGVAVWMLGRVLPGPVTLALWAAIAFVSGYCLLMMGDKDSKRAAVAVRRGFGVLALVYGVLMLVGALAGRSDPLQPLAGVVGHADGTTEQRLALKRIKSVADFDRELAAAQAAGRPLMLDFYADWCVSCKEMEDQTFTDPGVQAELARAVLLQADVTANDDEDQALLEHFGILGPPTIVFFAAQGPERRDFRVVGFQPASEFRPHAARAFAGSGT
jgi:thiol:disulfide interchange protein DsbD